MGIGMLALYAALAVVALWLVAELLLQNRAPVHWRGAALGGFLLVAAGMAVHSVPVIAGGALAFAVGQAFVTLSVKRGYTAGWSLRSADGSLPGPLAKVPLLGAATGGTPAPAVVAAAAQVGEVGPIEATGDGPADPELPEPAEPVAAFDAEYGYESVYETQQQPMGQQPVGQQMVDQAGYPYQEQQLPQQQYYDPNQYQPEYGGYYQPQPQPQDYAAAGDYQQAYPSYEQQQWQQPQQQYYDPNQYQPEYGAVPQQQAPAYEYYQQPQPGTWP
ncbi:hypothetical protein [Kitasatospora sp. LaBMicrA B282]|uniref:hypothetical protein n=1 Tax=Kitasatospora sp. LaBMicrA B282 TaxID=3420949 RepID=UPI003D129E92